METLYTFGCSYTRNSWPTWADWLSTTFYRFHNHGLAGSGNRYIFNQLIHAIHTCSIGKNDTVVIAWSTPVREDRYINGEWISPGNIYNQSFYPSDWVKKYFDPYMGLMETINYADASIRILENIGCRYYITWMMVPDNISPEVEINGASTFIDLCDPDHTLKPHLNYVLSHNKVAKNDIFTFARKYEIDNNLSHGCYHDNGTLDTNHPTPISAYMYTKNILCPVLGIDNFDITGKEYELATQWQKFMYTKPKNRNENMSPKWPQTRK